MNVRHRPDQRGRRHDAHPRNRQQSRRHRVRGRELGQLAVEARDLRLQLVHFLDHEGRRVAQHVGEDSVRILKDGCHVSEHRPRANRDRVPMLQ